MVLRIEEDQMLGITKICGGPWIVCGVIRHEHHRDQSCLLTGQIYKISQRNTNENKSNKRKEKMQWETVPNISRHTTYRLIF